jgi:death-on-curing protein
MRELTLGEVLDLYDRIMEQSGGAIGIRDLAGLESALVHPRMTFDGEELYPSIVDNSAALGYSMVMNHVILQLAAGQLQREEWTIWLRAHALPRPR